ncbi:cobalamin B12-binding domain-containing protein, partial [Micromonospora sp. PPF5-17]
VARGLARAAMRLDSAAISETIAYGLATDGVVATWDGLLRPVLAGIGERHTATAGLIEVEHLMSRCVSEALAATARSHPTTGPARILLSCADEEQHTLPLEALGAALAEVGVSYRMLGARVPVAALLEAVARTGPAAVVLWSHTRATADPHQLSALLAAPRRPLLVLAAGPGWRADTLPAGVVRPVDLTEAISLALAVRDSLDQSATD